ncbi:ABC transporter ATP-binding protein [Roseateles sp. DAIF2]|uniref:ABC transporter ATP-binding protein n=1 Tax=Roseateles sp. DAIF2 TaxID=2714952 RepID=UPI0018A2ECB8|nr:ABC transporter ATP-binding protein [Roseateles sp. DAIF2]QPF76271.1 ABC transporter ATP-binding protein [Roseateles sp. DAIF2]
MLELQLQHKRFAGAHEPVLGELSLRLAAGEVLALVGASGCGKSTLLRLVAGLERDFEGRLWLDGAPLAGPSRAIGYVFQEPRLFPWLTVAENVGFDIGQGCDRERVAALLAEVGLSELAGALPKQLSGGQAQRVAIARALYTRPRLLLLDEPFSALDAFTRLRLQDLVLALARAHGTALLLVTHDVDEALRLANRVLVMQARPGRIAREIAVPRHADAGAAGLRAELLQALQAVHAL